MRGKLWRAAVVTTVAIATAAGTVYGGETSRGGYELELSTQTAGAPTGLGFHVLYKHPDDPDAKPPAVTSAVFELPAALEIDDTAVPQCTASDEDFQMRGRDACPAESQVGDGKLTAMTGFPGVDPVTADVVAFNGDGEVIEAVFFEGTNVVAGMDRLTIEDGKLVAHPPATPGGPPDGRTVVREIRLELPERVGAEGRPYVSAPDTCPTGTWLSRAQFEFADGGSTVVTSESPCRRDAGARPALHTSVRPKRARRGKRTTFRIAARSADARCIDHARIRLGGRRARTGTNGRARVRARFAKAGKKRVIVSKAGCGRGKAAIRVRARR